MASKNFESGNFSGDLDRTISDFKKVNRYMFEFIKNISPTELGIIVIILIILFGSKLIVGLARTSGETVKEIKKIKKTFTHALEGESSKSSKK